MNPALLSSCWFSDKNPTGTRLPAQIPAKPSHDQKVLRIGIPGGISSLSYSVSQVVTTSIIALVGVTAVSAKIYVSTIVFYVYVLGLSLGLTTSLMTSWLVGAGNYEQAYRLNLQNLKITVTLNAVLSTLLALFGYSLLKLFTDDPQILSMGHTILFIDIFVEIFRGFNHIEETPFAEPVMSSSLW